MRPLRILGSTDTACQSNWWYTYPPEKYESQIGSSSQLLGKIKNVPNHQPASDCQGKAKCVVYTSQISLLLVLPHYQKWRVNHHKVDFPANI